MFITAERANKILGNRYSFTLDDITVAQMILETYTGRMENTVDDADDLELFAKATAYQAAYMKNNDNNIFEQASVDSITQDSSSVQFRPDLASPFIAPLAVMALRQLTWKKSKSIHTGKMRHGANRVWDWRKD